MVYAKAIMAIIVSLAGALATALGTGNDMSLNSLSGAQWVGILAAVLGSGGIVWLCANLPGIAGGVMKAAVAFLSAGCASLITALDDHHVTQAELLTAFIAAVVATGLVYQTPNAVRMMRSATGAPPT